MSVTISKNLRRSFDTFLTNSWSQTCIGRSGGGPGGLDPPMAPIYFNIKLLIHAYGPIMKSGQTPFWATPDPLLNVCEAL